MTSKSELERLNIMHGRPMMEGLEREVKIVAAALRKGGSVRSLPAPARHHHIISEMNCEGLRPHDWEQGFLGDDGEFYSRFQAWQRAYRSGQTTVRHEPPELFTEDLW